MTTFELVDCPRLHGRLALQACISRHMGRAASIDPAGAAICADCPLGAHRATVAGERVSSATAPAQEQQSQGRRCCNPECGAPSREGSRYCSRACKMAVDRVRARIIHRRKVGRYQEADRLQASLDEGAERAGWTVVRHRSVPQQVRSDIEIAFGEPVLVDGQRAWMSAQVWRGLGYAGGSQLRVMLRRAGSQLAEGRETWTVVGDSIKAIPSGTRARGYVRVFTEIGVWKLCMLARTPDAARLRERLLEGWQAMRGYWQEQEG